MATLALACDAMVGRVEERMGWASPTGAQSIWALARLNDGYARFLKGLVPETSPPLYHDWLFLRPYATMSLWATATGVAAGAPSKDNGTSTVTSAAAMFYPSMIGHGVTFTATEKTYVIASYTSSKVVVVTGDASGEANLDVMTVTAEGRYSLPSTFAGMYEDPVYVHVDGANLGDLEQGSLQQLYRRMRASDDTGDPVGFALQIRTLVTTGQIWWLRVHPVPDTTRTIIFAYRYRVEALTDSGTVYHVAGQDHDVTILQFAYAEIERIKMHKSGPEEVQAQQRMLESVAFDEALFSNAGYIEQLTDWPTGLQVH